LTGSLAFTRAPSRTRSQKAAQLLQFLQTILTSSATFGALHIAVRLAVFLLTVCCEFFILRMTDTYDVALSELPVAVLLILLLRFC